MTPKGLELCVHPPGECDQDMVVDTPGGRFRIDYDEELPVSPVGPLVFFAQFLQASGHFEALCEHAPLTYLHQSQRPGQACGIGHYGAWRTQRVPTLRAAGGVALRHARGRNDGGWRLW
jgi:hypothetical protein